MMNENGCHSQDVRNGGLLKTSGLENGHHSHGSHSHGCHDHHVLSKGAPDNGNHFHATCLAFPPVCTCCDPTPHPMRMREGMKKMGPGTA